jgi:hypothetical protein
VPAACGSIVITAFFTASELFQIASSTLFAP